MWMLAFPSLFEMTLPLASQIWEQFPVPTPLPAFRGAASQSRASVHSLLIWTCHPLSKTL